MTSFRDSEVINKAQIQEDFVDRVKRWKWLKDHPQG